MKTLSTNSSAPKAGYAMLTVVLIASCIGLLLLATTIDWTTVSGRQTDRHNEFQAALAAAEGATEKAVAYMVRDFKNAGDAEVNRRLPLYQSLVPASAESAKWTSYLFSDADGTYGTTEVLRVDVTNSVGLAAPYLGLRGAVSTYRLASTARLSATAGVADGKYNFAAVVEQELKMTSIPVFQFAIFYNGLLEFTWAAPLTVRGRVHANGGIYTGSSQDLTFNAEVTSVGVDQKMPWYGKVLTDYTGSTNYNLGYQTNSNALVLPIGTNNTPAAVKQILNIPAVGEAMDSPIGKQRYYNKAELTIILDDGGTSVKVKNAFDTTSTIIPWSQADDFIDTNEDFTDQRQGKRIKSVEIDIGRLSLWAATSTQVIAKLGVGRPPNLVYVIDRRTLHSSEQHGVRLKNASSLPSRGLTVATPNPLYIQGNFNQPNSAYLNTTNTSNTKPASLVSDALTILSADWDDSESDKSYTQRVAAPTTINAAIITGNVLSSANGTPFSGGVVNLPRLLEDWNPGTARRLTINGSMVNLFQSTEATAQFRDPGIYYRAPSRDFNFDRNFLDLEKSPPGTPELRLMVRSKWSNPAPP